MTPVVKEILLDALPGFGLGIIVYWLIKGFTWHVRKLEEMNPRPRSQPYLGYTMPPNVGRAARSATSPSDQVSVQRGETVSSTAPNGIVISDIEDAPRIVIDEEQRQMLLRSLAVNSLFSPGFEWVSREIAKLYYGEKMFDDFRKSLSDLFPPPSRSAKGREDILADSES